MLTRHLTQKRMPSAEAIAADPKLRDGLIEAVRWELAQREQFKAAARDVLIEPLLDRQHSGTNLGGHFTTWLKLRRERLNGGGSKVGSSGFGFRLTFRDEYGQPKPVTGPIALGYGCHFGLGLFVANT